MKQTAVMIVENKVEAEAIALFDGELTFIEFMDNISKYFNQAKAIEKEQIENAFNYGQFDLGMEAEEYYNETFKSE
jgi:hypothetical protein